MGQDKYTNKRALLDNNIMFSKNLTHCDNNGT